MSAGHEELLFPMTKPDSPLTASRIKIEVIALTPNPRVGNSWAASGGRLPNHHTVTIVDLKFQSPQLRGGGLASGKIYRGSSGPASAGPFTASSLTWTSRFMFVNNTVDRRRTLQLAVLLGALAL